MFKIKLVDNKLNVFANNFIMICYALVVYDRTISIKVTYTFEFSA